MAEALFSRLGVPPESIIVDPFAGSAVTGTAARARNLTFYGVEAHPLVAELGRTKLTTPPDDPKELIATVRRMIQAAQKEAHVSVLGETNLVHRSFSQDTLQVLLSLRELIQGGAAGVWEPWAKWALLATLRDVASVKVGWPYQRPGAARKPTASDPAARFAVRAQWIADDLSSALSKDWFAGSDRHIIITGDSGSEVSWGQLTAPADACLSSPPYLNNFDYADATRLEVYFWKVAESWSELCDFIRADMVVATTQQTSALNASEALQALDYWPAVATRVSGLVSLLQEQRLNRPRGKEYDRVLPSYSLAMINVLRNLANNLKPGAECLWLVGDSAPYGVYIDTPDLLRQLAECVGFELVDDVILRKRGLRWANNGSRHQQPLTERLVWMRRS
ncbi:hypothetical protein ABZS35_02295 [Micromonospora sp. NPDC005599]|uniref:hypothetical protein n=1 Tax=unclassified Micromonospora TaxID=2617518 RepID=UPI0033BFB684